MPESGIVVDNLPFIHSEEGYVPFGPSTYENNSLIFNLK